jgi:pimeloyl-ACP methyl ester carboxylesterase
MSRPTLVLVHGAWHGAWSWQFVGEELTKRGVNYVAVDLPSATPGADPATYLADDAAAVVRDCAGLDEIVLVGHSYGGSVILEAAPALTGVRGLVFVAALVPEVGQSSTETAREFPGRTDLDNAISLAEGLLTLDREGARTALFQDVPDDRAGWALDRLSTQTLVSFTSPRMAPDTDAPRRYIACDFDRAVAPKLQSVLATRCDTSVHLPTGHSPFLNEPHTLADLLMGSF